MNYILGIAFVIGLVIAIGRKYLLWILIAVALYFIVRWFADMYWFGKDKGKW